MKKILIATPMFGGMCSMRYTESLIETLDKASADDFGLGFKFIGNNPLVPLARNDLAAEFLNSPVKWDKLLFIDADISWTYEQFKSLCSSDKPFVGGTYCVKRLPLSLNFKPLQQHSHYFDLPSKSIPDFNSYVKAEGNDTNEIAVELLPTGFLMIDRGVMEHFAQKAPKYKYVDLTDGIEKECHDFFRIGAVSGRYLTEDWFISEQATKYGYQPYLKTDVIVGHEGSYVFGI